ncbi:putative membrane protein YdjX (TVP38/TMEM64 family) [Algoriphagus aquaeductus]|uniref:Putative membrane protein YdjX (TVP38/TMEM64 family) n=1 Tax=Algoriphagus aquaeductus TaxID=475299 RepID=A0A326RKX1_9BACT|nr:VTT domain-containing protein [Algoriphagus aquaeductus]PZV79603.1 putative membrane protein YdjX (TVP38/TMEM64 family) [Algoriphagus aquaeductus]
MTKKGSIFKILVEYFKAHPVAVIGWIWVGIIPLLGSFCLVSEYALVETIPLQRFMDHALLTIALSCILGLALLPTTLTALACGFFWGWTAFPDLLIAYILANGIGYALGKMLNADFLALVYARNPELEKELQSRIERPSGLVFFIRISPVIPFAISNFLFASLKIPFLSIIRYGVPGMLPRTFLAFATGMVANSFLGAKESLNHPVQWIILIFLLILSVAGIYHSWKKTKP